MYITTREFVHDLVSAVPELRPLLDEHLADNYGELLPHVLFGDITRWVGSAVEHGVDLNAANQLLALLDSAYADHGDDVCNLITVSFLESLDPAVVNLLSARLRAVAASL